ncbi:MAG: sugar transporter [Sutterella sp.]|nr:sugar transporter [Sutterella sp.]
MMTEYADDEDRPFLLRWLPVLTLTLCVFVFNTSEFIPIGLLTDIGRDFDRTEAETGWLVTAYAWIVAAMSLPLMLLASRTECRRLMMTVVGLFVASHVLSSAAGSYCMLMASRIGVACSHAVFWSVVSPLAVEVAPKRRRSTALGMIVAGSSIAMIVGLPLGRVLGLWLGWRMTFMAIGIVSAAALFCLWRFFPSVQSRNAVALNKVPELLSKPALVGIYILTPVIMTGNFAMYSYIEPFLARIAGMNEDWITLVLVGYGAVGIAGSWLFSRFYDGHPFVFMKFAVVGIAVSLLLMYAAATAGQAAVIALCLFWGLSVTAYNLVFQSAIMTAAPQGTAVAMSVYSGIYNVGIGSGALVGGLVCTHLTIADVGYAGGLIAAAAAVFCLWRVVPIFRRIRSEENAN